MSSDEEKRKRVGQLFGDALRDAKPLRYAETEERVAAPQNLREFLLDVHHRIKSADDAATVPSDDLLQGDRAYGGLDKGTNRYSFVYFPERGVSIRWQFSLLAAEIKEIGTGQSDSILVRRFEKQ